MLLTPIIFTGCNNDNAGAQTNGQVISTEFSPILGAPFASRKDDGSGEFENGSFSIDTFLYEDGELVVSGLLRGASRDPSGTEVTLPVEITTATCNVLEMKIGPPVGLLDPILIVGHKALSQSRLLEFCQIAIAHAHGENDALVGLLNQDDNPVLLTSCSFWDAIECVVPIAACALSCEDIIVDILIPDLCFACLEALDASMCIDCFG